MHSAHGAATDVGLGFYSFTRFHIDTRGFRRWGSAGPDGNESPCAVLERGGDPEAPPPPRIAAPADPQPVVVQPVGPAVDRPGPSATQPD